MKCIQCHSNQKDAKIFHRDLTSIRLQATGVGRLMYYLTPISRLQRIFHYFLSIDRCSIRMITWRRCLYGYMKISWNSIFVLYEYFRSPVRHVLVFSFLHVWCYPSMEATFYCNVERLPRKLQANLEWPHPPSRADREYRKPRADSRVTWCTTPVPGFLCCSWTRANPYENTCCCQLAFRCWFGCRSSYIFYSTTWYPQYWSLDIGCTKYSSLARHQQDFCAYGLVEWQAWSRWVKNLLRSPMSTLIRS